VDAYPSYRYDRAVGIKIKEGDGRTKAEQCKSRIFFNGVQVKGQKRTFPDYVLYIGQEVDLRIMENKTLVFHKGNFIGLIIGTN
jgi:hypothetical protein